MRAVASAARRGARNMKERNMRAQFGALIGLGLALTLIGPTPPMADGFKNCTKAPKASWKPASEAEAAAKAAGYEVRRSKIEGSCYEVYGVKGGKLFELFYSPADLKLILTKAK
jgi:hypothetical protein